MLESGFLKLYLDFVPRPRGIPWGLHSLMGRRPVSLLRAGWLRSRQLVSACRQAGASLPHDRLSETCVPPIADAESEVRRSAIG